MKPRVRTRESSLVCLWDSAREGALISQSSRYWCRQMSYFKTNSFTSFTIEVKTRGAVANPKARLLNWYEMPL